MADANFRRLVEQAHPIQEDFLPAWSSAGSHPLGPGIKATRTYNDPATGRYGLPKKGGALEALRQTIEETPPPVPAPFRDSVWAGLLDRPAWLLPLRHGGSELLASRGVAATEDDLAQIVVFSTASVFRTESEALSNGALASARFAGASILTMRLAPDMRHAEQAWLEVRWHHSTRDLVRHFEEFWPLCTLSKAKPSSGAPRVVLMVHPECGDALDSDCVERLGHVARILGMRFSVLNRRRVDAGRMQRELADGPSALVALGPFDASTKSLTEGYEAGGPGRVVRHLDMPAIEELLDRLRDVLIELAAVAPGLHPVALPAAATVVARRPALPTADPAACKHHGNHVYVLDRATGLWWTRDTSGHGGAVFKTYRLIDGIFRHEADRDERGSAMNKHKGQILEHFPESETHSCKKPASAHVA